MSRRYGAHGKRRWPLVAVALGAAMLVAQAAPAPTVDEIVARYLAACGGLKKIRSIETLREEGRVIAGPNREALVTRERKRPDRTRFEFTVQGVTNVFVSDGRHGWRMAPFEGDLEPNPMPEEAVKEAAEQADIEGPLVEWKIKGHQVELVGTEVVGDRETYKLKLTLKSGAVRHEYIDVKTFTRVRSDSTRLVRGRPVRIETTFGDYRKVKGMPFPHLIEVVAVGRPQTLRVVVSKIEINPSLSDARFEMPAPTQP